MGPTHKVHVNGMPLGNLQYAHTVASIPYGRFGMDSEGNIWGKHGAGKLCLNYAGHSYGENSTAGNQIPVTLIHPGATIIIKVQGE